MPKSRFITLATVASLGASVLVAPVTVQAAILTNENGTVTATLDEREQAGLREVGAAGAKYFDRLLEVFIAAAEEAHSPKTDPSLTYDQVFRNGDTSTVDWDFSEILEQMLSDEKVIAVVGEEAQKMATDSTYDLPGFGSGGNWASAQKPYNTLLGRYVDDYGPHVVLDAVMALAITKEMFAQLANGEGPTPSNTLKLPAIVNSGASLEEILNFSIDKIAALAGEFYEPEYNDFWDHLDGFSDGEGTDLFAPLEAYERELQEVRTKALEGATEYGLPEADPEDAGGTDETGEQGGTSDDSDDVDDKDDENSDDSEESDDSDSDDTELTDDETDGDGNGAGESDGSEDTDETLDETGDTDGEESEGEDDSSEIHDRNQVILGGVGLVASLGLGILSWLPIPGIKELNTAIQKQIGVFNPALAGFANNATGIVGGLGSLIGLVVSALSIFNGVTGKISTKKIESSAQ